MFKDVLASIKKLKNPYAQLMVFAVIYLFLTIRSDRGGVIAEKNATIKILDEKIEKDGKIIDSQNLVIGRLQVDTARIRAMGIIEQVNQANEINKILDSVKKQLR